VFFNQGIQRDLYEKSYYDPNDNRSVKTYDPRAQIMRIKNEIDINEHELADSINEFMQDTSRYVFDDFLSFVKAYDQKNIYIVSYGNIEFQEEKIKNSGIKKYVENIFITDNLKAAEIYRIIEADKNMQKEKIFFIDDRTEQICNVKEQFPKIITILLKRPEGRYQDMRQDEHCDFEAHNLEEAQKIINKLI
jgi:FMN phosphatase YigB (HAD superfamily)